MRIDRLLAFLDASDEYVTTELEDAVDDVACDGDADDEPSIGAPEIINQDRAWQGGASMSVQLDLEADDCDDEPSLGSIEGHPFPYATAGDRLHNQELWALGKTNDCEGDEHDGSEPDVDDEDGNDREPSFGWSDEEAARGRYPSIMGPEKR